MIGSNRTSSKCEANFKLRFEITLDEQIVRGRPILFITRMITDRIKLPDSVLLALLMAEKSSENGTTHV